MDKLDLTAIKRERVADIVYHRMRESIIERRLEPRQKLNPAALAESFGVSRTPVHEALVLLASEGLVELIPRIGTFVTELTIQDVADTMDVRRALELLACETACRNVQAVDVAALDQVMSDMEQLVSQDGEAELDVVKAHYSKNMELHQHLVRLSGNRQLQDMYGQLNAHLKIARAHVKADDWKRRLPQEQEEHRSIVRALAAKDLDQLKEAIDIHLRRSKESLVADLEQKEAHQEDPNGSHAAKALDAPAPTTRPPS